MKYLTATKTDIIFKNMGTLEIIWELDTALCENRRDITDDWNKEKNMKGGGEAGRAKSREGKLRPASLMKQADETN